MKNYYTIYNGEEKAGFGSLIQAQLILKVYCYINNLDYRFPGFKKVNHWQNESNSSINFTNLLNTFYDYPILNTDKNSTYISHLFLIKFWVEFNLDKAINLNYGMYKDQFKLKEKISIHYRRPILTDTEGDQSYRYCSEEYYESAIRLTIGRFDTIKQIDLFCINEDSFTDYLKEQYSVNIINNASLIETFTGLIESKALVTASSSLSWAAHLYGLNQLVVSRPFWHPWRNGTVLINNSGEVITNKLSLSVLKRKIMALMIFYNRKYLLDL